MRNTGIEIRVNIDKLTKTEKEYLVKNYDFELNAQNNLWTLWIHDDGNFPFNRELFNYMHTLHSVFNRRTKTTHLDLFIEYGEKTEFGQEIYQEDGTIKYYRNLTIEEVFSEDLSKVLLKKELLKKYL